MEKLITKLTKCCDQCGKPHDYGPTCVFCGRIYCYDCGKNLKELNTQIYSLSHVYYCPTCAAKAVDCQDSLFGELALLESLMAERKAVWAEWETRAENCVKRIAELRKAN